MNFPQNQEIWRAVDDYINYEVSNHGRVRNSTRGRIMKLKNETDGYQRVTLSKNKIPKTFQVHRLVAAAFIPNTEVNKGTIDHIDRIRDNNHFTNLRWVTCTENNKNKSIHKNNSSGVKGVCLITARRGRSAYWNAYIRNLEGKTESKNFSLSKFPDADAKQLACQWREEKEIAYGYIH